MTSRVGVDLEERNEQGHVAVHMAEWELPQLQEGDTLEVIEWEKLEGEDWRIGVVQAIETLEQRRRRAWIQLDG